MQRFVLAGLSHETNTFSPQPTTLGRFGRSEDESGLLHGPEAIARMVGTRTPVGGFLDILDGHDAELVVPLVASAVPSGRVTDESYETMAGRITDAVAAGADAVFLSLHGAMVTDSHDDAEGELLRRIRAIDPDIPIAVALDFHLGMSPALCGNATVVTGFRTYPHIDTYETAQRAGGTLLRALAGEVEPVISWGVLPLMTNMLNQTPLRQPMKDIMDRAIAAEANGEVLTASIFGGFPLSDIPHTGLSVIVVSDGDSELESRAAIRAGAEDYVAAGELSVAGLTRVMLCALERRSRKRTNGKPLRLRFGDFEIDPERMLLWDGGEAVELQRTPRRLLAHLVMHRDRNVSKDELLDEVAGATGSP